MYIFFLEIVFTALFKKKIFFFLIFEIFHLNNVYPHFFFPKGKGD